MQLIETIRQWNRALSRNGRLQAWIILEGRAWELLQQKKVLTCPQSFASDDENFTPAYHWMRGALARAGIQPPADGLTPWWCWIQREGDHPMPFREDIGNLAAPVVLELSLPAHRVAISCFDAWHWVLNRWYLHTSPPDEEDFDRTYSAALKTPEALKRKESSWDQIFDLSQMLGAPMRLSERSLQGCFWQLELGDVVRVVGALDPFPNEGE